LKKVEESTPDKITALVQERASDQMARFTLEVDPAGTHQIKNVDLRAIPRPAEFALPHLSQNELIAATQKNLQHDVAADQFSGAVLIEKDGKPVFSEADGLADREHKTPNTLKTRFRIGSMNKMFTAVSILQLVQAGKLGLDDPIGKYLPEYPNKDVASKVQIHHLLTHTGGTGDIFGPDFDAHRLELRTLSDYVKLYGKRTGQQVGVQQLRIHPAGRDYRKGERAKLLRLRAGARLRARGDDVDWFRLRGPARCRSQRGLYKNG
jgi:CubicO group peptidase (beta-lactamase class C family)